MALDTSRFLAMTHTNLKLLLSGVPTYCSNRILSCCIGDCVRFNYPSLRIHRLMTVPRRVTRWVVTYSAVLFMLIHFAEADNASTVPTTTMKIPNEPTADHAVERSVQLEHLEASGIEEIISDDDTSLTTLAHFQLQKSNIRKRAADYYNGVVGAQFYFPFDIKAPRFPPNAVIGLSRPLQRGGEMPRVEFVAQWFPKGGGQPHWGTVYFDQHVKVEGTFIQNGRILNLTQSPMQQERIRLLQYVGTPESNNFKFVWVIARNLDVSNAISIREQGNLCSPRLAPAVFQDEGYEFLGEADIDSRTMQYVFQGHVHIVDKSQFLSKVYVLIKQRCSCSCAGANVQS